MLTVIYWMEHRAPNGGARESTQGAEGVCNPIGGTAIWTNQYPPELVSLTAYVVEDGLVGHQWEERPLVLQRFYAPVQGNARARKWEWLVWGAGCGEGIGDFQDSIWNINEDKKKKKKSYCSYAMPACLLPCFPTKWSWTITLWKLKPPNKGGVILKVFLVMVCYNSDTKDKCVSASFLLIGT